MQLPASITLEGNNNLPVIETSTVQRVISSFETWLSNDNKQPFIIAGPEGCGKGFVALPNQLSFTFLILHTICQILTLLYFPHYSSCTLLSAHLLPLLRHPALSCPHTACRYCVTLPSLVRTPPAIITSSCPSSPHTGYHYYVTLPSQHNAETLYVEATLDSSVHCAVFGPDDARTRPSETRPSLRCHFEQFGACLPAQGLRTPHPLPQGPEPTSLRQVGH